eukprot:5781990-Lingulodinium_polyedra.AAC.1
MQTGDYAGSIGWRAGNPWEVDSPPRGGTGAGALGATSAEEARPAGSTERRRAGYRSQGLGPPLWEISPEPT